MSENTDQAFVAIQTAVDTLLNGQITGGVYDEVPPNPTFPYTQFGEPKDAPFEARGVKGRAVVFPFEIHSRDKGGKFECFNIMGEIIKKMTAAPLAMVGWKEVWKTYQSGTVVKAKEEPGISYKGYLNFLIVVNKT